MLASIQAATAALPDAINGSLAASLATLELGECSREFLAQTDNAEQFVRTCAGSEYCFELLQRRPTLLDTLVDVGDLHRSYPAADDIRAHLADVSGADDAEQALYDALRLLRQREMFRIIWRDLNRLATMQETTRDLTWLAEVCIQAGVATLYDILASKHGVPRSRSGLQQHLLVLGMGKLGAGELNLSSDIDLIFAFPESGDTDGDRSIENQLFFTRLGQRLIKLIDSNGGEGFVFRVDMRLRPYGQSGALALNFDALEEYYQDQGRDWERYAMIKARVVAGPAQQASELMDILRPFSYRRYIDFSVIESLRQLKQMIRQEVARKGLHGNVKLGSGGIREVEFIAQSFQLVRGGRDPQLQERSLLKILDMLVERELLPGEDRDRLRDAYVFLRNTEHAIQAVADQQTQELPTESFEQLRLAWVMGFTDWQGFMQVLDEHRAHVKNCFAAIVADEADEVASPHQHWQDMWLQLMDSGQSENCLQEAGFERAADVLQRLDEFRSNKTLIALEGLGRDRVDRFVPLLLAACAESVSDAATALSRSLGVVESILRRTAYLVLLEENPGALRELVRLCGASPWIAEQLARFPALLDELLNASSLYSPPSPQALSDELRQATLRLAPDDLEAHMDVLRYFKMAHVLRVAASEVTGRLSLMKVSDYLTEIAEVILDYVIGLAWDALAVKHGEPTLANGEPANKRFIIVGYGKLGGLELSYSSDLDIVFIYDAPSNRSTNGDRSIDNGVFYTRLGQRIIHILTTRMSNGDLYEVDVRLRPSGASGLLVSSLAAFERYQHEEAWTWEHQALVRARWVAGDAEVATQFAEVRQKVLGKPRDTEQLRRDVIEMREKMRDHLLPASHKAPDSSLFHLKHGLGGIVDIEFMVQYAVLAGASQACQLCEYSDNIRILDAMAKQGIIAAEEAQQLADAYRDFRAEGHRRALQGESSEVEAAAFAEHRANVSAVWHKLMQQI